MEKLCRIYARKSDAKKEEVPKLIPRGGGMMKNTETNISKDDAEIKF